MDDLLVSRCAFVSRVIFAGQHLVRGFFVGFALFFDAGIDQLLHFLCVQVPVSLNDGEGYALQAVIVAHGCFQLLDLFFGQDRPDEVDRQGIVFQCIRYDAGFLELHVRLDERLDLDFLEGVFYRLMGQVDTGDGDQEAQCDQDEALFAEMGLGNIAMRRYFQDFEDQERGQGNEEGIDEEQVQGTQEKRVVPGGQPIAGRTEGRHQCRGDGDAGDDIALFFPRVPDGTGNPAA